MVQRTTGSATKPTRAWNGHDEAEEGAVTYLDGVADRMAAGEGSRLSPELTARYRDRGQWREVDVARYLADALQQAPDRPAAVGLDGNGDLVRRLTYSELDDLSRRLATGLRTLGVGSGDTVSVMLSNRVEFPALVFAIARLGAVYSGIPVTYGRHEVAFMLGRARTKVLVVVASHGRQDLVEVARRAREDNPHVEHVVVLDGAAPTGPGWTTFDGLAAHSPIEDEPPVDPGRIAFIGFTSGTTNEPKAVVHIHRTVDALVRAWPEHLGPDSLGNPLVNLVMSPVGHGTGFYWGVLMTTMLAGTGVYLERWSPRAGLRALREQQVTAMVGSPTFLADLLDEEGADAANLPHLTLVSIPGAPIPRSLVPRGRIQLGTSVLPSWGMTECGIGISATPSLPRERMEQTDGVAVDGFEARVVGADDSALPAGQEGDLQVRGPGLFVGYLDRADFTAEAFTTDGWFRTGDRGRIDDDGMVTLLGRTKDIIIRGGENIPVVAIEDLLYRHPAVTDAAVVGVPDPRLGERAEAIVSLRGGQAVTLDDICDFLLQMGLSKRFLPEGLTVLAEMPKTMSGKIRKVDLRQSLADRAERPPAPATKA